MELSQEQIEKIINSALPEIKKSMVNDVKNAISWDVKEEAAKAVSDHVMEYVTKEIIPEITNQLVESKEGLISLGTKVAPMLVETIAIELCNTLKKKLEQSWERKKIFESLLC